MVKASPSTQLFNQATCELFLIPSSSSLALPLTLHPNIQYLISVLSVLSQKYTSKLSTNLSIPLVTMLVQTNISCLDLYSRFLTDFLASYLGSACIIWVLPVLWNSVHITLPQLLCIPVTPLSLDLCNIPSSFPPQDLHSCCSHWLSCSWPCSTWILPIHFSGMNWKYLTLSVNYLHFSLLWHLFNFFLLGNITFYNYTFYRFVIIHPSMYLFF